MNERSQPAQVSSNERCINWPCQLPRAHTGPCSTEGKQSQRVSHVRLHQLLRMGACLSNEAVDDMRLAVGELLERRSSETLPVDCQDCTQLIEERDRVEAYADQLAEMIGVFSEVDIGEHSSSNCPWEEAIEAMRVAIGNKPPSEKADDGLNTG